MLEEKFGQLPHSEIDPDLCVALGAAIQAGREMGLDSSSILLEITPYTFGTSAVGEIDGVFSRTMFVPIIRRNTKLPASRTEAFATMVDDQEVANIQVYQGEARDALDNIKIGAYRFDLSKAPCGSVILINYELDLNGILKLEALEKDTGRKINAVIENAFAHTTEKELAESKERIAAIWEDDSSVGEDPESSGGAGEGLPPAVADLLQRAESNLAGAPEEDRDEMVDLIEDIRDAVESDNSEQLEEATEALEDILFYLEEA